RIISEAVMKDRDRDVRNQALRLLAEGRKNVPETWQLIRDRVTTEKDAAARNEALQLLIEKQKDIPEKWQVIRDAAAKDEEPAVRITALTSMLSNEKYAAEVKELASKTISAIKDSRQRQVCFFKLVSKLPISNLEKTLLSRDLDSCNPGIDPLELITSESVRRVCVRLTKAETEIRELYQKASATLESKLGICLRFEWTLNR
ncbi:MAG TPA: hypothetical protein VN625_10900, partial [Desulfuromonadaceae bacterium]|nr:hypothetical protein [Desulfuromonadaceae bacterium]